MMVLIRRFAWTVVGRIIAAVLQAASLILVARGAGPETFGYLAAFMGLIIVFQTVFDFGLFTFITKLRASDPKSPSILKALTLYRNIGMALGLVLVMAATLLAGAISVIWWLFIPLALAGWLERQSDVRLNIALADGDVWKNSITLVFRRMLAFALLVAAMETSVDPVLAFGLGSLTAALLSLIISHKLVALEGEHKQPSTRESRELLRSSRHFWINSMGVQMRNLDVLLVGVVSTPVVAGFYGSIARSLSPLLLVASSMANVLLPMATKMDRKEGRSLVVPTASLMSIITITYSSMAVFADDLVILAFGSKFLPAVDGFRVVFIGLIFASLSSIQTALLQASGKEKVVGRVSLIASVLSLAGIAIGVSLGAVMGAAIGLAFSYVAQSCMLFLASRSTKGASKGEFAQSPAHGAQGEVEASMRHK